MVLELKVDLQNLNLKLSYGSYLCSELKNADKCFREIGLISCLDRLRFLTLGEKLNSKWIPY